MKYYKFLFLILFFMLTMPLRAEAMKIGLQDGVKEAVIATSTTGVMINAADNNPFYKIESMRPYVFKAKGDNSLSVSIGGRFYNLNVAKVIIKPTGKGYISAKKRWYRGGMIVENRKGELVVINDLPLEDYILGVVPSEMPSKWSYEALKAQAIAARSYAIANRGKRASRGYDLKDTPEDQAYGGASSETYSTNKAVIETKGIVVTYNRKVIPAYYSASAGGHTVNSGQVWNKDLPYLRSVPSFDDGISKNGHGIGMSQHGANNLAKQGYNAYQILTYFYNNIKFGRLDPSWIL